MILGVLAYNLVPLLFEPTILRLCLDENQILEGATCLVLLYHICLAVTMRKFRKSATHP